MSLARLCACGILRASPPSGERAIEILLFSFVLVIVSVGVHYEALKLAYQFVANVSHPHRLRVAIGVLIAFVAHMLEASLFAVGWLVLIRGGMAELSIPDPGFMDALYFSFSTYSSLGYGDIVPLGDSRMLAGIEAILGLVLIAWTASFTYLEMRDNWTDED